MAEVFPDGWQHTPAEGAQARVRTTLGALASELDDSFRIYHGVHWTRVKDHQLLFGQVDLIIVSAAGDLMLLELAFGFLSEDDSGLARVMKRGRRHINTALAATAAHLRARLESVCDGGAPAVDVLLYCPDHLLRQPGSAGLDPMRIVDASRREALAKTIIRLLSAKPAHPARVAQIHRFLVDELELVPEVSAIVGQTHTLYTRLAGGLAEWARKLEIQPHRLRVTATAGSGKTQLALAVLRDAVAAGKQALYVCYNRPLADHIARIAPNGAIVASYHQLCDRLLRQAGLTPDFSRPGVFAWMEQAIADLNVPEQDRFDLIIIDEGQDFLPVWRDNLLRLARSDSALWWLEDPMQNLYGRAEVELPGWVRLRSARNYRSPADIVALLNRLPGESEPVQGGSPLGDSDVEVLTYHDEDSLLERTRRAITRAIGLGFKRDMLALITFRGREKSNLCGLTRLGQHRLRAFNGRYDLLGSPLYSEGELLIDSVYRFKGQSAPCVIFTEIDFVTCDEHSMRKLFVGATRAGMKLIIVISERALTALHTHGLSLPSSDLPLLPGDPGSGG